MFLDTIKNNPTINNSTTRSVVAGAIGGLAGGAVKGLVEYFLPVRKVENRSAQLKIIDNLSTKITGTPISVQNEELAEQLVNFPVGASVGAAYGYGKKNKDDRCPADCGPRSSWRWSLPERQSRCRWQTAPGQRR